MALTSSVMSMPMAPCVLAQLSVAVMVVNPGAMPVTSPALTVATVLSKLVNDAVAGCWRPSVYTNRGDKVTVSCGTKTTSLKFERSSIGCWCSGSALNV